MTGLPGKDLAVASGNVLTLGFDNRAFLYDTADLSSVANAYSKDLFGGSFSF